MFKWLSAPVPPLSHMVGLGLLAAFAFVATGLPVLLVATVATAILVLVAVWEHVSLHGRRT
jgi:low temperature requirement protein LtrA